MKEWLPAVVLFLQIAVMVAKWWFDRNSAKKKMVEELKKEAKDAKDAQSITSFFDHIR